MFIPDGDEISEAGRQLGHDLHASSRLPRQSDWPDCIREGFDAAAFQRQPRPLADRFTRKWLQLRLGAWKRGRIVAADVTPELLRSLDLTHCPVTRETLTHGVLAGSDWSVDRLNNDAAYAASNLAVMSTRANVAKASLGFDEVLERSRAATASDGLMPAEWLRLAVLMLGPAFATRQHLAPQLPLCAPLPLHSVRLALQQVQHLWTTDAVRHAGKNRLLRAFRSAGNNERCLQRLDRLAEVVHHALKDVDDDRRWDIWLQPVVMNALVQWRDALTPRGWAEAAAIAGRLAGARRETPDRLALWHLSTRGYRLDVDSRVTEFFPPPPSQRLAATQTRTP